MTIPLGLRRSAVLDKVIFYFEKALKLSLYFREVRETLDVFGLSGPEDNMEMIRQIKNEVRRLCKKSVIAAKVVMYEQELEKYERKVRLLVQTVASNEAKF